MMEVVVYFTDDYSLNESIWVSRELKKEEITKKINERFETWYFYDIL